MEFFSRMLPALLVVLLLVASGMGAEMRAEAARPAGIPAGIGEEKGTCGSASYDFQGPCIPPGCVHVCRSKGFPYAHCRGIHGIHGSHHRCFCTRPC